MNQHDYYSTEPPPSTNPAFVQKAENRKDRRRQEALQRKKNIKRNNRKGQK